jgi:rRNA maturation RNase YbeY
MSLAVRVSAEGVRPVLSQKRVEDIARRVLRNERVRAAELSITFVTTRAIARLNEKHLGHQGTTDVISFGFAAVTPDAPVVGDIYIAPDVARENARRHGEGVREEIARLVIHGVLHVLGHDHPEEGREESAMWRRQEALLRRVQRAGVA